MKKLVIDIKDGYAAIAAGGQFDEQYFKVEFSESDFVGETGNDESLTSLGLAKLAGDDLKELLGSAEETVLVVPMRFSLVKPIDLDRAAVENLGDDFLAWESNQQLPEDLGDFETGFYKLRQSFDNKTVKYLFYASTKDFVDVLSQFVAYDTTKKLVIKSEAIGLFNAVNLASGKEGVSAAIALEPDGASVVIACDGDFVAGKFIPGDSPALGQEIMYYIFANSVEDVRPKVFICGDLDHMDHLGSLSWADRLATPTEFGKLSEAEISEPMMYIAAAGVNLTSDD